MKLSEDQLKAEIVSLMEIHELTEFPTRLFLEGIGRSDLFNSISRNGGFKKVSASMGIEMKSSNNRVWNEEEVEKELRKFIQENSLTEMPSKPDLNKAGMGRLANAMNKRGSMEYWSERIGLPLKSSETLKGKKYEALVLSKIKNLFKGLEVERMSTRHPYDLLVNSCVKIDVKVGTPHNHWGVPAHTFRTAKKHATCDIYICAALDESGNAESFYIVPAKEAQVVTLNICGNSKYLKYKENWAIIEKLVTAYEGALA